MLSCGGAFSDSPLGDHLFQDETYLVILSIWYLWKKIKPLSFAFSIQVQSFFLNHKNQAKELFFFS
jgi:hypothetical protein